MDEPENIPANIGIVTRVDLAPGSNPHQGLDRPYLDEPEYLIGQNDTFRFMASVPGGLEEMSAKEIQHRFSGNILLRQGKLHFEASLDELQNMHTLRSVDNIFITLADVAYDWNENNSEGKLFWTASFISF